MKRSICLFLTLLLLLSGCTRPQEIPQATTAVTTPTTAPAEINVGTLRVSFIDVGQADCALLECDGAFALIDAGNEEDGPKVVEYLQSQGVRQLELVVGTHPHEDHIGGMPHVLKAFRADTIWFSYAPYANSVINQFKVNAAMQDNRLVTPTVGQSFSLGSALITVLGPVRNDYEDVNDLSLVLMVEHGQNRFLFTGDMEMAGEDDLLDSGADVRADVLKVGHHGSYSSTGYRFLREVAPKYAVISVGAANDYGLPHDDPLSRLQDAEVTIYRTDKMYTVVAVSDGDQILFTWGNRYAQPWTPKQ